MSVVQAVVPCFLKKPRARLNINISRYCYRDSHFKDKKILRLYYLNIANPYTLDRRGSSQNISMLDDSHAPFGLGAQVHVNDSAILDVTLWMRNGGMKLVSIWPMMPISVRFWIHLIPWRQFVSVIIPKFATLNAGYLITVTKAVLIKGVLIFVVRLIILLLVIWYKLTFILSHCYDLSSFYLSTFRMSTPHLSHACRSKGWGCDRLQASSLPVFCPSRVVNVYIQRSYDEKR